MQKQITAWSYSRYSDYKQCPFKVKCKHILRIKEPTNEAMERGSKIHGIAEKYIKNTTPAKIPADLKLFPALFKMLRGQYKKKIYPMIVEDMWAFDAEWNQCRWDDWNNCKVRMKLDCAYHEDETTLVVIDWKTGKFRPDNMEDYIEQLELFSLGALLMFDHIETVKPYLKYLDHGITYPDNDELIFTRKDLPNLKKLWAKRTKKMLNDKSFAPTPNRFCNWCFYRNANKAQGGGQCKF